MQHRPASLSSQLQDPPFFRNTHRIQSHHRFAPNHLQSPHKYRQGSRLLTTRILHGSHQPSRPHSGGSFCQGQRTPPHHQRDLFRREGFPHMCNRLHYSAHFIRHTLLETYIKSLRFSSIARQRISHSVVRSAKFLRSTMCQRPEHLTSPRPATVHPSTPEYAGHIA